MDNKLEVIVQESGLDKSKAQIILDTFKDSFEIAAHWEREAKEIIVTDGTQVAAIEKAKEGRIALSAIRIKIEKTRKQQKEQSLREGQAIDGIAKTLTAVIIPIEDYLREQEKFVQIKQAKRDAEILRLAHEKEEQERIADEKAEREVADKEQERIQKENARLKKEADKREKEIVKEREEAAAKQKATEVLARIERETIEETNRVELDKQAKLLADSEAKAEKERLAHKEAEAKTSQELIFCPNCHFEFALNRR